MTTHRQNSAHPRASAPSAGAGLGMRAASTRIPRHGAIAICLAHVLNSLRAPPASLTGKLTRHEQRPNRGPSRGRCCTNARYAARDRRRQSPTGRPTPFTSRRRGPDRAELCRPASSRGAIAERPEKRADAAKLQELASEGEPGDETIEREIAVQVKNVIRAMSSQRDRTMLVRFYLDEEEKESICRDLGLSPLQFDKILHRARGRLRKLLESGGLGRQDLLSLLPFL
jgi:DNA-directed RNA polymerase specialized sigma24 family protein